MTTNWRVMSAARKCAFSVWLLVADICFHMTPHHRAGRQYIQKSGGTATVAKQVLKSSNSKLLETLRLEVQHLAHLRALDPSPGGASKYGVASIQISGQARMLEL